MRRMLFRVFLVLLAVLPFSPVSQAQHAFELPMPIPPWVKEGVCVVYTVQTGGRAWEEMGSAIALTGYTILLVTNVEGKRVYGLEIRLFNPSGTWNTNTAVKLLNTPFSFLSIAPDVVETILRESERYLEQGILVEGGPVGNDLFYFAMTSQRDNEEIVTSYEYSRDGVIKRGSFTRRSAKGVEAASVELVGVYEVELPTVSETPAVAKQSVAYGCSQGSMGVWVPCGRVELMFEKMDGSISRYRHSVNGQVTQTTVLGTPLFGPFYLHPELLRRKTILAIPEIDFRIETAGVGQRGGTLVVFSIGGQVASQGEYDPATGLLWNVTFQEMGLTVNLELLQGGLPSNGGNVTPPSDGGDAEQEVLTTPYSGEVGQEEEMFLFPPGEEGFLGTESE